jgi:hypothetical protein
MVPETVQLMVEVAGLVLQGPGIGGDAAGRNGALRSAHRKRLYHRARPFPGWLSTSASALATRS